MTKHKETPLQKASEEGRESIVQLLSNKEAYFKFRNREKQTHLHIAVCWGRKSTMQLLIR